MSGIYTTEGIVFRAMKYGETSMISDIYTLDFGLKSYIAGNVRNKRNAGKANVFYPGNIVQITAYPSNEGQLARLKEIHHFHKYKKVNNDVIYTAITTFLIEMCRKAIQEHEANVSLYEFIKHELIELDKGGQKLNTFHLFFLLKLTSFLGFEPLNNWESSRSFFDIASGEFTVENFVSISVLTEEVSMGLHLLLDVLEGSPLEVKFSHQLRDELLDKIVLFYKYHVPSFGKVNSLEVLRTIL